MALDSTEATKFSTSSAGVYFGAACEPAAVVVAPSVGAGSGTIVEGMEEIVMSLPATACGRSIRPRSLPDSPDPP